MNMTDEGRHDCSHSRRSLGSCGIDDILGEVGVVAISVFGLVDFFEVVIDVGFAFEFFRRELERRRYSRALECFG